MVPNGANKKTKQPSRISTSKIRCTTTEHATVIYSDCNCKRSWKMYNQSSKKATAISIRGRCCVACPSCRVHVRAWWCWSGWCLTLCGLSAKFASYESHPYDSVVSYDMSLIWVIWCPIKAFLRLGGGPLSDRSIPSVLSAYQPETKTESQTSTLVTGSLFLDFFAMLCMIFARKSILSACSCCCAEARARCPQQANPWPPLALGLPWFPIWYRPTVTW